MICSTAGKTWPRSEFLRGFAVCLAAVIVFGLNAVEAKADIIYGTLGTSPGDYYDDWQVSYDPGISFNSGSSQDLTGLTLNLINAADDSGSVVISLYADTALNVPDFTDGSLDTLTVIPDSSIVADQYTTLTFGASEFPLVTNTEYWIIASPGLEGTSAWWAATFLNPPWPTDAASTVGTAGQYSYVNGGSGLLSQSSSPVDAFQIQILGSSGQGSTPEPSTVLLTAPALLTLCFVARKRNVRGL